MGLVVLTSQEIAGLQPLEKWGCISATPDF